MSLVSGRRNVVSLAGTRSLTAVSFNDTLLKVIRTFRNKTSEAVFNGESQKGFPANLVKVARRKLRYLNAAADLGDLTSPPGNRLEALAGDRKGNTRSGSTTNSECALFGRPKARQRSRSWTTTRRGRNHDQ